MKQEFSKLGKGHILYVLDCLEKNGGNIRDNAKGYVLTSLYNSGHSVGFYMPHSQSAFKDGDNSNPELKGKYDIRKFFESNLRKPLNV